MCCCCVLQRLGGVEETSESVEVEMLCDIVVVCSDVYVVVSVVGARHKRNAHQESFF